jgi:hypothetical protein
MRRSAVADTPHKGMSARLAAEVARQGNLYPYALPSAAEVEAVARTLANRAASTNWEGYILAARTALIAARLVDGVPQIDYEYGKAYPLIDGWESGARFDAGDGIRRYVRVVTKAEYDEHKADGHDADGTPYWNYVPVRRVKAPKWEAHR